MNLGDMIRNLFGSETFTIYGKGSGGAQERRGYGTGAMHGPEVPEAFYKIREPIKSTPEEYLPAITQASEDYDIPSGILSALLEKESSWRPDIISGQTKSPVGAEGIAQFMPATQQEIARTMGPFDPFVPDQAIPAAAYYLDWIRDNFDVNTWDGLLQAYNAGIGNYQKYDGNVPFPETQDYVAKIRELVGGAFY